MPNNFVKESAEKFRSVGGALANAFKEQAPMLFPSELERMSSLAPQERRTEAGKEAMNLAIPMFTLEDIKRMLPKNIFEALLPDLSRTEGKRMFKGTGEFASKSLANIRKEVPVGTPLGITKFPSMDIYFGEELGDVLTTKTVRHELFHIEIRDITKKEMGKIVEDAGKAGIEIPNASYITEHWNPKKYGSNKEAARAEEMFVHHLETLTAEEVESLIKNYGTPAAATSKVSYDKGKKEFLETQKHDKDKKFSTITKRLEETKNMPISYKKKLLPTLIGTKAAKQLLGE